MDIWLRVVSYHHTTKQLLSSDCKIPQFIVNTKPHRIVLILWIIPQVGGFCFPLFPVLMLSYESSRLQLLIYHTDMRVASIFSSNSWQCQTFVLLWTQPLRPTSSSSIVSFFPPVKFKGWHLSFSATFIYPIVYERQISVLMPRVCMLRHEQHHWEFDYKIANAEVL